MVIWYYSKFIDDNLDYDFCFEGENSWCGFQRDVVKGISDYIYKDFILGVVVNVILLIFEVLSEESFLMKCLYGGI